MANHTRVFHRKPTREECIEAVRKQFYSGEGAIQWAGEAVARANCDLIPPDLKPDFLKAYEAGTAREWLKGRDPSLGEEETSGSPVALWAESLRDSRYLGAHGRWAAPGERPDWEAAQHLCQWRTIQYHTGGVLLLRYQACAEAFDQGRVLSAADRQPSGSQSHRSNPKGTIHRVGYRQKAYNRATASCCTTIAISPRGMGRVLGKKAGFWGICWVTVALRQPRGTTRLYYAIGKIPKPK
jgi:hypothetical protein